MLVIYQESLHDARSTNRWDILLLYIVGLFATLQTHSFVLKNVPPVCNIQVYMVMRRRDISACIATRYRLDGPGIESRWGGARFSTPVQTGSEAHPASYTMGTGSFPGVKRPGRGVDHPPHLASRLKKE